MKEIEEILKKLYHQEISIQDAKTQIKLDYLDRIDNFAQLDVYRQFRTGIPEVIFAETKENMHLLEITRNLLRKNHYVILTRLRPESFEIIHQHFSNGTHYTIKSNKEARIIFISDEMYISKQKKGKVGLITAGTSDIPIAEEASIILDAMGIDVLPVFDVGIAGLHRIFPPIKEMLEKKVDVFIVVAGMEGTLPGVVSALVDKPVIGVPTSTGYGLGEKGKGALTTMLQSCSPGLAVVNIDNGFGAATFAALIILNKYNQSGI